MVYTNCDSVRVIVNEKDTLVQVPLLEEKGIRHPPVVFKGAYSFVDVRALHRAGKPEQCSIVAEDSWMARLLLGPRICLPNVMNSLY